MPKQYLGRFGGKLNWKRQLVCVATELETLKDKAIAHSEAKHDGTCYQSTIYNAAFEVEKAVNCLKAAIEELS